MEASENDGGDAQPIESLKWFLRISEFPHSSHEGTTRNRQSLDLVDRIHRHMEYGA
jgi:hypothetical protein